MWNKSNWFYLQIILFIFSILSCNKDINQTVELSIKSPVNNWVFDEDSEILFAANMKSNSLIWESSIDGYLGTGTQIKSKLSSGTHTIYVKLEEYSLSSETQVFVRSNEESKTSKKLITSLPLSITNCNDKKIGLLSLDNTTNDISFYVEEDVSELESTESPELRNINFQIELDILNPDIKTVKARTILNNEEKSIYVMNTISSYLEPHEIYIKRYYSSENLTVWIPIDFAEDMCLIDECIENVENIIISRISNLWGKCADINSDGTFSLIFTGTINDEKVALGFFNPSDFFVRDKESNPYSNEMDVLYVAIPQKESETYSVSSISATIAHELTHAVNFTSKTWKRKKLGCENVQQEKLFLDEGWSHLSETLCGFGISGGNIDFMKYFLNNTKDYSFCESDYLGRSDSVGQRGAMSLFLYWLFCKAGGFNNGGVCFLKSMTASDIYGWECIDEFFNISTDKLLINFFSELFEKEISEIFDLELKDLATGEFYITDMNMKSYNVTEISKILPKSFISFYSESEEPVFIDSSDSPEDLYLYKER